MQYIRGRFEFLVLEELMDQFCSGVIDLVFWRIRVAWQKHLRLDMNQSRGHYQKLSRNSDIKLLHCVQVFEVLFSDASDRYVVNRDFFLLYEEEQQVKRAFEHLQLDLVLVTGLGRTLG